MLCGYSALSLLLLVPAVSVDNPTGTCVAEGDGSRPGYAYPGSSDTYLPDCNAPLPREYWRVFVQADARAYIIPRPDAAGLQYGICGDTNAEASLFRTYGMCDEVVSDPALINSIPPADALQITHALHSRLVFQGCASGSVSPFAPPDDVLLVCDSTSDAGVQDHCAQLRNLCSPDGTCAEMAIVPSASVAAALAGGMNQLYGVDPADAGRVPLSCSSEGANLGATAWARQPSALLASFVPLALLVDLA